MSARHDVAIVGAGFSGSILAWILAKQGRRVALIDAACHPRFAVGESSTPIADLLLRRLGQQYGIDELVSLSTYGGWKKKLPQITCGLKRGFSYYVQPAEKEFFDTPDHQRSLLVAASDHDDVGDTQWYRAEVDEFLFGQAIAAGADDWTRHRVESRDRRSDFCLTVAGKDDTSRLIESDWIVDASGHAAVLAQLYGVRPDRLKTNTRSVFAHFEGVRRWSDLLAAAGHDVSSDPFCCDDAAQHHLLDDGWLWMLRFDNGITSVGLTSSGDGVPLRFNGLLDWDRYPSVMAMLEGASMVAPDDGPRTGRGIRPIYDPVIQPQCIMLPTAAATIDPLHSTGIARALAGVDRVARIILEGDAVKRQEATQTYRQVVLHEARFVDRLVNTAYQTMNDFPRFAAACMLYFAGAIRCEERYGEGETPVMLWNADDQPFVDTVQAACDWLTSDRPTPQVAERVRQAIGPWNSAGLMDPAAKNRYAYTATK